MTLVAATTRRCRQTSNWTDERVVDLRKHMAAGMSASQISREMGGVTRNGVIGKIHRLGLSNRKFAAPGSNVTGPIKPRMHQMFNGRRAEELAMPQRVMKPQPARLKIRPGHASQRAQQVQHIDATEIIDLPPDTSEFACTIAGLEHGMCRWPLSDPAADMRYCGAAAAGAWCPRHRRIAYTPYPTRRR